MLDAGEMKGKSVAGYAKGEGLVAAERASGLGVAYCLKRLLQVPLDEGYRYKARH